MFTVEYYKIDRRKKLSKLFKNMTRLQLSTIALIAKFANISV